MHLLCLLVLMSSVNALYWKTSNKTQTHRPVTVNSIEIGTADDWIKFASFYIKNHTPYELIKYEPYVSQIINTPSKPLSTTEQSILETTTNSSDEELATTDSDKVETTSAIPINELTDSTVPITTTEPTATTFSAESTPVTVLESTTIEPYPTTLSATDTTTPITVEYETTTAYNTSSITQESLSDMSTLLYSIIATTPGIKTTTFNNNNIVESSEFQADLTTTTESVAEDTTLSTIFSTTEADDVDTSTADTTAEILDDKVSTVPSATEAIETTPTTTEIDDVGSTTISSISESIDVNSTKTDSETSTTSSELSTTTVYVDIETSTSGADELISTTEEPELFVTNPSRIFVEVISSPMSNAIADTIKPYPKKITYSSDVMPELEFYQN